MNFYNSIPPDTMNHLNNRVTLHRLLLELKDVRDDLHRSAAFTDTAIHRLENKLQLQTCGDTDADDWAEFIHNLYVMCMNSKNANHYDERLMEKEGRIWDELLEVFGSDKLIDTEKID